MNRCTDLIEAIHIFKMIVLSPISVHLIVEICVPVNFAAISLDEGSLMDYEQWLEQAEEGGDVETTSKPLPQHLQLLQALLKHLPEVEQAGGVRAVPFMQVRGGRVDEGWTIHWGEGRFD